MNEAYRQLMEKAEWSHQNHRSIFHFTDEDIALARLYAYGFRTQTIGAFYACRQNLAKLSQDSGAPSETIALLSELEAQATIPVPADFRVLLHTLYFYDQKVKRTLDLLEADCRNEPSKEKNRILNAFRQNMNRITGGNGIFTAKDDHLPEQGGFVVPNLGITIAPLVYGDHHSWNTTLLEGSLIAVTSHRHHAGVEIHLGWSPMHGRTFLGDYATETREGYAMPIPAMVDHGLDNLDPEEHWVPFIFGSLTLSGWGVFFDVEPREKDTENLPMAPLDSPEMNHSVYIEREIERVAGYAGSHREVIIPASATASGEVGALELSIIKVGTEGASLGGDIYKIYSVVKGKAEITIGPAGSKLEEKDHFGVPAFMDADIKPLGDDPLVLLEGIITKS